MKQIEVLFEELENGVIKVVDFKNVAKFDDIPYEEYRTCYPSMGIVRGGTFMIYKNEHSRQNYGVPGEGGLYFFKHEFNELIKTMKQCGENYARAKKNAKTVKPRVIKSIKI